MADAIHNLALEKILTIDLLHSQGCKASADGRGVLVPYHDEDGSLFRYQLRLQAPSAEEPRYTWVGASPSPVKKSIAYVPRGFVRSEDVIICEGPTDPITLAHAGFSAIGLPGGGSAECLELHNIAGARRVYVIQEPGATGAGFPSKVAERLRRLGWSGEVFVLATPPKDPSDMWIACGGDAASFASKLRERMTEAELLTDVGLPAEFRDAPVPALVVPHPYHFIGSEVWKTEVVKDERKIAARRSQGEPDEVSLRVSRVPVLIRSIAERNGAYHLELVFNKHGRWRSRILPRELLGDPRTAAKVFASAGILDDDGARPLLKWLSELQAANEGVIPVTTYVRKSGWYDDNRVFVLGSRALTLAGESTHYTFDPDDSARFRASAAGERLRSIETWRELWASSGAAAVMLAASLAATLRALLDVNLAGVHLWGASSEGKSIVLYVAGSAWGRGADGGSTFTPQSHMTEAGLELQLKHVNDLPCCLDDIRQSMQRAVFMIFSGEGKARATRSGEARECETFRSVLLSTGERLAVDDEAQNGAHARVIQLQWRRPKDDAAWANRLKDAARNHYGHLGPEFVRYVIKADHADLRKRYETFRDQAVAAAKTGMAARQAESFAVLALVESITHELWEIGCPDGRTVLSMMESDQRHDLRRESDRALELLADWMTVHQDNFPWLQSADHHAPVYGYHDGEYVYVVPSVMRDYLQQKGLSAAVVMSQLGEAGLAKTSPGRPDCHMPSRGRGECSRAYAIKASALGVPDGGHARQQGLASLFNEP